MQNDIIGLANARYGLLLKFSQELNKKLKSFPDGRIKVKSRNNRTYYYLSKGDSRDIFLKTKDQGLIEDLIQKQYLEKVLSASIKEAEAWKSALDKLPGIAAEDVYDTLSDERRKLVKPIITPIDRFVREWEEKPYKKKVIGDDVPVYMTLKGERVRSKSEQIIADRLFLNGIPYKYECPLKVGSKIIHPDFTILKRSERKEVYHEHCGKLDETGYTKESLPRISNYILNGFALGDRLFLSLESSVAPLDVRVIDKMITDHYM